MLWYVWFADHVLTQDLNWSMNPTIHNSTDLQRSRWMSTQSTEWGWWTSNPLVCSLLHVSLLCSNYLSLLSGAPLAHLRTRSTASLTCLEQQIHSRGTVQSSVGPQTVSSSSTLRVKALIQSSSIVPPNNTQVCEGSIKSLRCILRNHQFKLLIKSWYFTNNAIGQG